MRIIVHSAMALFLLAPAGLRAETPRTPRLSTAALKLLTPAGYRVAVTAFSGLDEHGAPEFLVALADAEEDWPSRPVTLLLVRGDREAVVEDTVVLHNEPPAPGEPALAPNYCFGLSRENVGDGDLFLLKTRGAWGGSGAANYSDFFRPEKGKLRLVKSFLHGRMDNYYFTVFENAAYDAHVECARGEKHGRAYVYTCWLEVTKLRFNGTDLVPVGSERLLERKGNRYLSDSYWFISTRKELQKKAAPANGP
jgi:hypothetical protein